MGDFIKATKMYFTVIIAMCILYALAYWIANMKPELIFVGGGIMFFLAMWASSYFIYKGMR